jgi:hypothetical protein
MLKLKKNDGFHLKFRTDEEKELYKKYQKASADLECTIRDLIIEAMRGQKLKKKK